MKRGGVGEIVSEAGGGGGIGNKGVEVAFTTLSPDLSQKRLPLAEMKTLFAAHNYKLRFHR